MWIRRLSRRGQKQTLNRADGYQRPAANVNGFKRSRVDQFISFSEPQPTYFPKFLDGHGKIPCAILFACQHGFPLLHMATNVPVPAQWEAKAAPFVLGFCGRN
jgi:hypothetical protein